MKKDKGCILWESFKKGWKTLLKTKNFIIPFLLERLYEQDKNEGLLLRYRLQFCRFHLLHSSSGTFGYPSIPSTCGRFPELHLPQIGVDFPRRTEKRFDMLYPVAIRREVRELAKLPQYNMEYRGHDSLGG